MGSSQALIDSANAKNRKVNQQVFKKKSSDLQMAAFLTKHVDVYLDALAKDPAGNDARAALFELKGIMPMARKRFL
jgi:hypothetical protein